MPLCPEAYRTFQTFPPPQNAGTFKVRPPGSVKRTSRITSFNGSEASLLAVKAISAETLASTRKDSPAVNKAADACETQSRPIRTANQRVMHGTPGPLESDRASHCGPLCRVQVFRQDRQYIIHHVSGCVQSLINSVLLGSRTVDSPGYR